MYSDSYREQIAHRMESMMTEAQILELATRQYYARRRELEAQHSDMAISELAGLCLGDFVIAIKQRLGKTETTYAYTTHATMEHG